MQNKNIYAFKSVSATNQHLNILISLKPSISTHNIFSTRIRHVYTKIELLTFSNLFLSEFFIVLLRLINLWINIPFKRCINISYDHINKKDRSNSFQSQYFKLPKYNITKELQANSNKSYHVTKEIDLSLLSWSSYYGCCSCSTFKTTIQ